MAQPNGTTKWHGQKVRPNAVVKRGKLAWTGQSVRPTIAPHRLIALRVMICHAERDDESRLRRLRIAHGEQSLIGVCSASQNDFL
jgi:hypothetical protein